MTDSSEKKAAPESDEHDDFNEDAKRPYIWGSFYLILGIAGLATCIYQGFYDLGNSLVPLYGTVVAEVLIAALSILMIVYGYRVLKKDL